MRVDLIGLINVIRDQTPAQGDRLVIGISGYGGSGKSTLAMEITMAISNSVVIGVDDYYVLEKDVPDEDWDAFDRSQLRNELDRQLAEKSKNLIICEGVGLFHPDTLDRFDFNIWVDTDLETATLRGMKRDREVYLQDHDHLWRDVWVPTEQRFEAKHNPKAAADYFVV